MKFLILFLLLNCTVSCSIKTKSESNSPLRETAAFHKNASGIVKKDIPQNYNIAFVNSKKGKIICYSEIKTVGQPDFMKSSSTISASTKHYLRGKNIKKCSDSGLDVANIIPPEAHLGELTVAIGPGAFFLIPAALCTASGFMLGKGVVKAIRKQEVGLIETPELAFGGITGVSGVGTLMVAFLAQAPHVLDRPGFIPRLSMVSCGVPTGIGAVAGVVFAKFFD